MFIPHCIYLICLLQVCSFVSFEMLNDILCRWYLSMALCYCIIVQTVYSFFKPLFGFVIFSFFFLFCMNYKCFTDVILSFNASSSCIEMPCTVSFPKKKNKRKKKKTKRNEKCVGRHRCSISKALCIDFF